MCAVQPFPASGTARRFVGTSIARGCFVGRDESLESHWCVSAVELKPSGYSENWQWVSDRRPHQVLVIKGLAICDHLQLPGSG